jgi:hypothetical protein
MFKYDPESPILAPAFDVQLAFNTFLFVKLFTLHLFHEWYPRSSA